MAEGAARASGGTDAGADAGSAVERAAQGDAPGGPCPAPDWEAAGFGLYLHWPFCSAKCPYCDFNSHVTASVDEARWARAFEAEIARAAAETGPRPLRSIFLGGGTPSLMSPALVEAVLAAAAGAWGLEDGAEVTLEANPTSVEAARFRGFRDAGVNRVSLGVQALEDADLRRLGRRHDAAQALAAVETARAVFDRVSFDLIYARQHQALAAWEAELARALALGPDHLSLYQLTIEDGTPFAARRRAGGLAGLPDEDLAADLYEATQALCGAAGLPAYEVSNHAVPGAEGRHNLVCWRSGDWAGIGPGAHGRLTLGATRWATEAHRAPEAWLRGAEAGSAEADRSPVPDEGRADELLMMGLRLREGVSLSRHAALGGRIAPGALSCLEAMGLVAVEGNGLRVTARGRPVLDAVLGELVGG